MPIFACRGPLLIPTGGGLEAETTAWVNAVVADGGSVSGLQQTRVNNLIAGLKTDCLFTVLDRLWLYGGESDAHQARTGGGLDATQAGNLASRINAYLTAWGINVY